MKQLMVRYTVKPECAAENTRLIEQVFESLQREATAGVVYSSYRLDDGVTFVHVASIANSDDNPLRKLEAFQAFTSTVRDRCEVPPVTTTLHEVGRWPR